MKIHPRSDWAKRQFTRRVPLDFTQVKHIVIHWPGSKGHLTPAQVVGCLRGWQDWHMDGHGWTDIAYNEAVDANGDVWILRGDYKDGATKNYGGRTYSILVILGTDDTPTDAQLATLRQRAELQRGRAAAGCDVLGHRDLIHGTECPGELVYGWIHHGMPLADEPAPVVPDPTPELPAFPLRAGSYFGPKAGPVCSVSGYYATLPNGKRGHAGLLAAQRHAAALGLYSGKPDGLYGPQTAAMARSIQKAAKLKVTGLIDATTWRRLFARIA